MTRRTTLFFALLLSLPLLSAEDIQLKDGSKITGQITGFSNDKFQVKTSYGEMQLPRTDIVSIDFPDNRPKDAKKDAPAVEESLTGPTYTNRTGGFQLTVPDGWLLAPELRSKDVLAALKSPDEGQYVMVTVEKFEQSLASYVSIVEAHIKGNFDNYQEISQTDAQVAGKKASRLIIRGDIRENKMPAKFMIYVFADGQNMVRLSFLTAEPVFEEVTPKFEKIAASYRSAPSK